MGNVLAFMQNFMRFGVALSTVFDTARAVAVLSPALWPVPSRVDRMRHSPRVRVDVDLVLVICRPSPRPCTRPS